MVQVGNQTVEGGPVEKGRSRAPGARGMSSGRRGGTGVTSATGTAAGGASGVEKTAVQEQQSSRQLQPPRPCPPSVLECPLAVPWQQCPREVSPFLANLGAEQTPEQVYLWSSGAAMSVTRKTAACRSTAVWARRGLWSWVKRGMASSDGGAGASCLDSTAPVGNLPTSLGRSALSMESYSRHPVFLRIAIIGHHLENAD